MARPEGRAQDPRQPEEGGGRRKAQALLPVFRAQGPGGYSVLSLRPVARLTTTIAASAAAKPGTIS